MRIESERSGVTRRLSFETTASVDRAIAAFITVVVLAIAQVIGLPELAAHRLRLL
jgi:hypothetical protein